VDISTARLDANDEPIDDISAKALAGIKLATYIKKKMRNLLNYQLLGKCIKVWAKSKYTVKSELKFKTYLYQF
jgi:hypothetical protein